MIQNNVSFCPAYEQLVNNGRRAINLDDDGNKKQSAKKS